MLKKCLVFFLICFFGFTANSQNLVPNPSFEIYDTCPAYNDNILNCANWLNFGNSPDYYNGCAPEGGMSAPYTSMGFHYAHTGVGMAGLITWLNGSDDSSFINYREYIGAQLTSILNVGQKYYFSFFTSYSGYLHGWKEVAANKIGMRFSTVPNDSAHHCAINNFANLYTASIYTDTVTWVQISGYLIADSAYKYIAIGNFFDDAHTDTSSSGGPSFGGEGAYYFIDDVCVTTDSLYNQTWTGIQELNNTTSKLPHIYPNPANDILNINSADKIEQIQLINSVGQIIYNADIKNATNYTLTVSNIPQGLYILRIKTENNFSSSLINLIH